MQKTWSNQNVDLKALTQQIAQFLETRDFDEITALETGKEYQVMAGNSSHNRRESDIVIKVDGKPNEFSITLESCREEKRFNFPIILSTMFGGGYFLLREIKSTESWQKFERDFWQNVGRLVEGMRDSASSTETEANQRKD